MYTAQEAMETIAENLKEHEGEFKIIYLENDGWIVQISSEHKVITATGETMQEAVDNARAKLLGLDAPTRIDQTLTQQSQMDAEIQDMLSRIGDQVASQEQELLEDE